MERIIFHYTDVSALIGIIQNNEIWLSNTNFLNDPSEVFYASTILKEEIESFTTEDQKLFKPLTNWIFGVDEVHDRFVMSLSKNNDSLNL